jgi:hypothetical protein
LIIQPWLDDLPKDYQPKFLGSLFPSQLQIEIAKFWVVIVNLFESVSNRMIEGLSNPETVSENGRLAGKNR